MKATLVTPTGATVIADTGDLQRADDAVGDFLAAHPTDSPTVQRDPDDRNGRTL